MKNEINSRSVKKTQEDWIDDPAQWFLNDSKESVETLDHVMSSVGMSEKTDHQRKIEVTGEQSFEKRQKQSDFCAPKGNWTDDPEEWFLSDDKEVIQDVNRHADLIRSALLGRVSDVERLIEAGASVEARDSWGRTPLMLAACCGHYDVMDLLIKRGASVEAQDEAGNTPLMHAVIGRDKKSVEFLLAHDCSVNMKNNKGETALILAAVFGEKDQEHIATEEMFIAPKFPKDALITDLLIRKGARIDEKDNAGQTALVNAALHQNRLMAQLLLVRGANPNEQDNQGKSFLDYQRQDRSRIQLKKIFKPQKIQHIISQTWKSFLGHERI